ncbi:hypothetical protein MLD38_038601 [Melastoma candidum]|uniref:Uncharacterized protein n=1 Tax=Melastoma candidum TaxID=119954 RepID=A0ACB9L1Q8_9MYRT|nr:hypothetical protein MLD38_038601 [Melastoma candidum]
MDNNHSSFQQDFWQFSDQLRNHNSLSLSLNDSIWSSNYLSKHSDRLNTSPSPSPSPLRPHSGYNNAVANPTANNNSNSSFNVDFFKNDFSTPGFKSDFNGFNFGWKDGFNGIDDAWKYGGGVANGNGSSLGSQKNLGFNDPAGFGEGVYSKSVNFQGFNGGKFNLKGTKGKNEEIYGKAAGKKVNNKKNGESDDRDGKVTGDKRFKTLPPSESLPKNEAVGGYIFVCNNDTMQENLKRQLFGLPPRYRDSVRQITPGLPIFLYNYSTHQLHGIFEAASFGGSNIDPTAWEDKKCPGESRFPAQVRVMTRKICDPLEEDSFRPILHHYDGPKFRLELNVPEALSLLDIFAEQDDNLTGLIPIENTN